MKDQFVIACLDNPDHATTVLSWARHFARRLNNKSLMILHVAHKKSDDRWLEQLELPFASLLGAWHTAIEGLPTAFNGILAVTAYDPQAPRTSLAHPKRLLREFRGCKTAYLCVPVGAPTPHVTHTALTLTHQREGKEKLVWASYLARFLGSRITIAHPAYRDAGLRQKCHNNLRFANKIFSPLDIPYESVQLPSATRVDQAALDLKPDVLIASTTDPRERDLFDLLMPKPELRLLYHAPPHPFLFLNPRDDLYILCD